MNFLIYIIMLFATYFKKKTLHFLILFIYSMFHTIKHYFIILLLGLNNYNYFELVINNNRAHYYSGNYSLKYSNNNKILKFLINIYKI